MSDSIQMDPMGFSGLNEDSIEVVDYSLSETEALCLKCNLSDCKENSKKCPIKMVKVIGLDKVQEMLAK